MNRISNKSLVMVVVILMIMVIIMPSCIFASSVGDVGRVYLSDGVLNLSDGHRLNFKSIYNESTGCYETAYCVEHRSSLYSSTSMSSSSLSTITGDSNKKAFLSYALAYGFRTSANAAVSLSISSEDGQKYAATQFVIWNIISDNYDSNFNRTIGWYDYVSSNSTYYSSIMSYTEDIESRIRNAVRERNSGIVVFDSASQAINHSYGKTSIIDNRSTVETNALAERLIDFVTRIYDQYLNGSAYRKSQMDYWVNMLFDGAITPERLVISSLESQECKNKFESLSNEDFVRATYIIMLNRNADSTGLNYFTSKLNNGLSRRELVELMMTTPEWKTSISQMNVSTGEVEYHFDYEFPYGINPSESVIVENTNNSNVTFTYLGGNNKWRVSIHNGGRIVLRLDYGRDSSPIVWTPSRANHQKVISISDYSSVIRYVAFNAQGEISYNPTATNTATPTPVHTATPTPVPITHVTASVRLIKRGETVTSASYNDIEINTSNGLYSDTLCTFNVSETNLNGATFYAVPRSDVYAVIGNNQQSSRERIYYSGQQLPLVAGNNGVYYLSNLFGGVYDIYEADSPDGYIRSDGIIATIFVEDEYSSDTLTYTSVVTNRTLSDMVTINPDGSLICTNELIDVDINVTKNIQQGELSDEVYYSVLSSIVFGLYTSEDIEFFANETVAADTLVGISGVTINTDEEGNFVSAVAEFGDLLVNGNYYLREIDASPMVVMEDSIYPVVVNRDDTDSDVTIDLSIDNQLVEGSIHIRKVDIEYPDVCLSGAVFDVYSDINGNAEYDEGIDVFVGTMTEEEEGEYYLRDLLYGEYVVIERVAPEGFIRRTDSFEVSISENDKVVSITDIGFEGVYNVRQNGTIEIRKTDVLNTNIYYSDSVFELIRDMDGDGVCSANIFYPDGETEIPPNTDYCIAYIIDDDGDGTYMISGLMYGTYFVREISANNKYTLDENTYTVELSYEIPHCIVVNGEGETFTNSLMTGGLRITKHSEDGHIEGISFRVTGTDAAGNIYDEIFTTDFNGVIAINDLNIGVYTVSEVNNEDVAGYILPDDVVVTIEPDVTVNVDMTNITPTLTPTVPVVKTGETSSDYLVISFTLIGISILLSGCFFILRKHKE